MRSACYPRRTFYPMSDGPSIRDHRITSTYFRICSRCLSCSQAPLCACTQRLVSNQPEGTFACLRYSLGGDRPSQTTHQTLVFALDYSCELGPEQTRVVFHGWLRPYWRTAFTASHLSYTCRFKTQCQAIVKVHRVFPSFCGYTAFSPRLQFHRVSGRDSVEIVTPFVQVGTCPTRNFATLGPL